MGQKSFASLSMEIDAEIEKILSAGASLSEEAEHELLKLRLYRFFQDSVARGWLESLRPRSDEDNLPIMLRQIEAIAQRLPGSASFSLRCFRGFNTSTVEKVHMTRRNCVAIRDAFPKTEIFQSPEYDEVRETWNETVGAPDAWTPHFLKRMTREGDEPTTISNCPLIGDYLLFRADESGYARPAFFRFYAHEIGQRIRSMGLRLDPEFHGLSSKGWVIRQQSGYMVGGYIIMRRPTGNIEIDGGFSLMSVSVDQRTDLVQMSEGRLDMAPMMHMQMPYTSDASCSRGILIRLRGSEAFGGQPNETKLERLEATLELHQELTQRFGKRLSLINVSKILEKATGISRYYFFQNSRTHGNGIPHSEAFVNSPSRDKDAEFAPLGITEVREKSLDDPKGNIGIEFDRPPSEFRS